MSLRVKGLIDSVAACGTSCETKQWKTLTPPFYRFPTEALHFPDLLNW